MPRETLNPENVFNTLQYGFSQAVLVRGGRRMLLSGQVGVDASERTVAGGLAAQVDAAFDNIGRILAEADGDFRHVAMLRIYIVESARREQECIVKALQARFPQAPPATSWIIVSGLSEPDWLVEIEAEAVLPEAA